MSAPKGNRFWMNRKKHGAPRKFECADELWEACIKYFDWSKNNPWGKQVDQQTGEIINPGKLRPLTIANLCMYLGIAQLTWSTWRREREDLFEVISMVDQIIYAHKFDGAVLGDFNANIISRDLGLRNKRAHRSKWGNYIDTPTPNVDKMFDGI